MFRKLFIFAVMMTFISGTALANNVKANNVKADKVANALAKYHKTGKTKLSILLNRINNSRVINDYNILFVMAGKKAYLNTLPHRCSTLGYEKAFGYTLYTNQLSHLDMITVIHPTGGFPGPTCGLGKFVEYKLKAKVKTLQ